LNTAISMQLDPERSDPALSSMADAFAAQHAASRQEPYPSQALRHDRITRLIDLLCTHQTELCEAVAADFGRRSAQNTQLFDILPPINALKYAREHLKSWMQPVRRRSNFPYNLIGAKSRIQYVPLGVIGNISPWNFPLTLALSPLGGMLAAGNRVMLKPSDLTPATSQTLRVLVGKHFDASELTVIVGDSRVAAQFARLPFDHLLFTGSTKVGRIVSQSAAANLVPVTLELGGKSPVLVGAGADLREVASKVMFAKTTNAGQICIAPDYLMVSRPFVPELLRELRGATQALFPEGLSAKDYVNIISERHAARLRAHLADAQARGNQVIPLFESSGGGDSRALAPHLVVIGEDGGSIMEEEIFGPILPVIGVDSMADALRYVAGRPRPLALYYFGNDAAEISRVSQHIVCGGLVINDLMTHFLQDDLPFGGVGESGSGSYHGYEGFQHFSHATAVFTQSRWFDVGRLLHPPFGRRTAQLLKMQIKR
jgi:coniferyl-aldehyde dehydrogenase